MTLYEYARRKIGFGEVFLQILVFRASMSIKKKDEFTLGKNPLISFIMVGQIGTNILWQYEVL